MAVIGTLAVNIIAKLNPFSKGMADARKQVHGFRRDVTGLGSSLLAFGKAALGVAGVYGLGRIVKSSITAIDELGELSDRIGINIGELQGLQHAAKMSGTSVESLTAGLEKMNVFIGEAISTGTGAGLLHKIGLDPIALSKMPREEQFQKIADGLLKIENTSLRAAAAKKIFGRNAGELSNVLRLGSRGLDEMSAEFDQLHGKMSEEEKRKVADFADAMDRIGIAMGGFKQDFVISIAEPAIKAINVLAELVKDIKSGKFLEMVKETATPKFMDPFGVVSKRMKSFFDINAMDPFGVLRNQVDKRLPGGISGTTQAVKEQAAETLEDFNRGVQGIKDLGTKIGNEFKFGFEEYKKAWQLAGEDFSGRTARRATRNLFADSIQSMGLAGRGTAFENEPNLVALRFIGNLLLRIDTTLRDGVIEARKEKRNTPSVTLEPAGL